MKLPDNVIIKKGAAPGPTVAIFGGVHGNETAGVMTVERLAASLLPLAGTVFLVTANPSAIARNVRLVGANLNRLFTRKAAATGDLYEHRRAGELMDLLDHCDALLDLHSYRSGIVPEDAIPFAICEAPSARVAALLPVPAVVSGFTAAEEGGSDGYMHQRGMTGICVELGALERPDLFAPLGFETAMRFLAAFGIVGPLPPLPPRAQRLLALSGFRKKTKDDFRFARQFRNLEALRAGETIAYEDGLALCAAEDCAIVFPNDAHPVGVEAFMLATEPASPASAPAKR